MQRTPPSATKMQQMDNELRSKDRKEENKDLQNAPKRRQKHCKNTEVELERPQWVEHFKEEIMSILKSWKNEQDESLKTLHSDIQELKHQNAIIQKSNTEIEKSVDYISKKYDDIDKKVNFLEKAKEQNYLNIKSLEEKIDHLEKYINLSTLEIKNVPKKTMESKNDLSEIMQRICSALNINIVASDLKDIYRINMNKYKNGPVIVQLSTTLLRNKILHSVKKYNKDHPDLKFNSSVIGMTGESVPIYLSERLSNKSNKLLQLSRKFVKENNYKFCWINNGRIFIRKAEGHTPIQVREESDLTQLMQQS